MSALAGALLLLAPAGAAWADQRECGNLLGMLRYLNTERSREQVASQSYGASARLLATELMLATARADKGDASARARIPGLRLQVAHMLASETASKEILAAAEKAITEVTFDISSKCPDLLKTTPPPPPPQAAVAPPASTPQHPSAAPTPPNVGSYTLKGTLGPCGSFWSVSVPLDFAINNGAVTGSWLVNAGVSRITGTVDSGGTLHLKLERQPDSMFGGKIIWQNGHWLATGRYTYVSKFFNCSAVWSATQANPS